MARKGCDVCGADGYSSPSVTVDAVATRVRDGAIEALMIQRGANPPEWKGKWAFPGGFVDVGGYSGPLRLHGLTFTGIGQTANGKQDKVSTL